MSLKNFQTVYTKLNDEIKTSLTLPSSKSEASIIFPNRGDVIKRTFITKHHGRLKPLHEAETEDDGAAGAGGEKQWLFPDRLSHPSVGFFYSFLSLVLIFSFLLLSSLVSKGLPLEKNYKDHIVD
jgi:hypothetical protein